MLFVKDNKVISKVVRRCRIHTRCGIELPSKGEHISDIKAFLTTKKERERSDSLLNRRSCSCAGGESNS